MQDRRGENPIENIRNGGTVFALGPMAGVTDLPYRLLCSETGADLSYTEMVSAQGLVFNNRNTHFLLETDPKEGPVVLQLFGKEPAMMRRAVEKTAGLPFAMIDINMGCPVPKIVKNGEGSALMKEPLKASEIVREMKKATDKPVTVKFRKGFSAGEDTAVEFAKYMEDAGADALTVHGRTRDQYYDGSADWDCIRRVKEAVSVPVFGSGDIFSADDAVRMVRVTGIDGVMVARGARGNPWIFRELKRYGEDPGAWAERTDAPDISGPGSRMILSGRTDTHGKGHCADTSALVPIEERRAMILKHTEAAVAYYGEYTGIRKMRSHYAWYSAGVRGGAEFRKRASLCESIGELKEILTLLG